MTGLNVITDAIINKAEQEAKSILDTAKADFDLKIADAKAEASLEAQNIINSAKEKAENIELSAKSTAKHKVSIKTLEKKAEIIKNARALAEEKIYKMPKEKYAKLLENVLDKHVILDKSGEIIFAKKDFADLPKLLADKLKQVNLVVSDTTGDFSGGFILKYGKIEENCTISAIFENKSEKITDYLNQKLFG